MSTRDAFFIQYRVQQQRSKTTASSRRKGLATVIVCADSRQIAITRAGRLIAENMLEINDLMRIHKITDTQLNMLDAVLRSVYRQAERFGVGFHLDLLPSQSGCCSPEHNP